MIYLERYNAILIQNDWQKQSVHFALENVTMTNLKKSRIELSSHNQTTMRAKIFKKRANF